MENAPRDTRDSSTGSPPGTGGQVPQSPEQQHELHSLQETLDVLERATDNREKLSLGEALDAIGQHSFAPLLLLPGLIMLVPGPAGWIDHLTKKRLTWLVAHGGYAVIAIACILIAAATPLLEFVPFSANLAGAAIVVFSLALMARDGLLAALAILLSLGVVAMAAYQFL